MSPSRHSPSCPLPAVLSPCRLSLKRRDQVLMCRQKVRARLDMLILASRTAARASSSRRGGVRRPGVAREEWYRRNIASLRATSSGLAPYVARVHEISRSGCCPQEIVPLTKPRICRESAFSAHFVGKLWVVLMGIIFLLLLLWLSLWLLLWVLILVLLSWSIIIIIIITTIEPSLRPIRRPGKGALQRLASSKFLAVRDGAPLNSENITKHNDNSNNSDNNVTHSNNSNINALDVRISRVRFSPFYESFWSHSRNLWFETICVFVSSNWGPLTASFNQYPWNSLRRKEFPIWESLFSVPLVFNLSLRAT